MITHIELEKHCKSCRKFIYHIDLESIAVTEAAIEITSDLRIPDNCANWLCNDGGCPYWGFGIYQKNYCYKCKTHTKHYSEAPYNCVKCEENAKIYAEELADYNKQNIPEMLFNINKRLENLEYSLNITIEDLKSELAKR